MQGSHPLAGSFALLCVGSALGLALLEWQDPFGWQAAAAQPVKEVSNLSNRISVTNGRRPSVVSSLPQSDVQVVVKLSTRKVDVYRHGEIVKQYPVAIGKAEWETPTGSFSVAQMREHPTWQHPITGEVVQAGQDNPLGSRWIGFLSVNGAQIGFHGTNQENLIGEAVSHGCIRMLNEDIEDLYSYVEMGSAVIVKR